MWKWIRRTGRVLAWWIALTIAWYIASPKLQWATHKTKNRLITNLELKNKLKSDTLYATQDAETNTILNLLSGFADKWELNALLRKYWYDSLIDIDNLIKLDPAMYKAVYQIHQANGAPNITLSQAARDIITWKEDFDNASFSWLWNRIDLLKLDSLKINFVNIPQWYLEDVYNNDDVSLPIATDKDRQRYLLNKFIAEMCHSVVRKKDWPIRNWIDAVIDLAKHWFKHDSMFYHIPWTYEYEAHTIIQPELVKQFIEIYKKNSDLKNPDVQYQIWLFYNGYFNHYKDLSEAEKWLQLAAKSKNKEAHYILGKRYLKEFSWYNSKDTLQQRIDEIDSTTTDIMEKIMSDKDNALRNTLFHFWQSARAWSIHAYLKLIDICQAWDFPDSKKIWIWYALELIHKRPTLVKICEKSICSIEKTKLTDENLANVYMSLAALYFSDSQLDKYNEWKKKAEDAGYQAPLVAAKP